MMILFVLISLLVLYSLFYLKVFMENLWDWYQLPKLNEVSLSAELDDNWLSRQSLDIVIPARNEATKIGQCLESIEHQTFSQFQVWMVNDRSTDQTGIIMRQFAQEDDRYHVIEGVDPPPGWAGKVFAIHQALPFLSSQWVLFLDADTQLHPENLARALCYANQNQLDMLTLIPHLLCETFWEKVILPAVAFLIGFRYPSYQVNSPAYPNVAIANGQYILIKQDVYKQLGGHQAVQGSIVEDLDFAKLAKQSGVRFQLISGISSLKVRMYTRFSELREGWTKNMYKGEPDKWAIVTLSKSIGLCLLGIYPLLTLGFSFSIFPNAMLMTLSLLALSIMLLTMAVNRAFYKAYPLYAFFHPLAMGIIGWFLWESRQRSLSKQGVIWKGRYYKP